jgi:hypothetical protein
MDKPVEEFHKRQQTVKELMAEIAEGQKQKLKERMQELEQQMQIHMAEQIRLIKAGEPTHSLTPSQAYIPNYRPAIRALKELVKACEVIDNRGTIPLYLSQEEHKKRSDATKKRHAATPPEKRKASTLAARTARKKAAKERKERSQFSTVRTDSLR